MDPVKASHSDIINALATFDRQPFRELLATFVAACPSPGSLLAWADKHPDRWAQCLAILGRLAGFTEKTEIIHSNLVLIANLSDHELMQRLSTLEQRIRLLPQPIDITQDADNNV